jgi:hypothetical protein
MRYYKAWSSDDVWACERDVWVPTFSDKRPVRRESRTFDPSVIYGRWRLVDYGACELYFKTEMTSVKDIRKVLDGEDKIRIDRLSKTKWDLEMLASPSGDSFDVLFNEQGLDGVVIDSCLYAMVFHGGYGVILKQKKDSKGIMKVPDH